MKRRRVAWIVAAVLALAVTWLVWPSSEQPFWDYLDERRAAELPVTRDEFLGPMPPAAENGAAELQAAWDALVADFGPTSAWKASNFDTTAGIGDPWPESLTEAQFADLAQTAERLRPGIDALVRALDKPRIVFPVVFDRDGWRDRGEVRLFSNVALALMIPAAGEPDSVRRLEAVRALLLYGERLSPDSLLDFMFASSARESALAALRHGVQSGRIDAVAARAACDALLRSDELDKYRRASRGDAVELIENYRALLEGRITPASAKLPLGQRIERRLAKTMRRLTGKAGRFDGEFERGHANEVVAVCRLRDACASVPDIRTLLTSEGAAAIDPTGESLISALTYMWDSFAPFAVRRHAATRLARIALAAAGYRGTHGDFPASLDDLKPMFADGVPLDPFTDAPFVYEKTSTGVRIASQWRLAEETPLQEATLREKCLVWVLKR